MLRCRCRSPSSSRPTPRTIGRGGPRCSSRQGAIDRLDMSAWHEAGHAIAFLALSWSIRYLSVASPGAGSWIRTFDWWAGECGLIRPHAGSPPGSAPVHTMAVATMAGPVAAQAVRIALGLQSRSEELHTEVVNAGDAVMLTLATRFLGIAPADADEFERALRKQATAILVAHHRVYGAMVATLVTHTAPECRRSR